MHICNYEIYYAVNTGFVSVLYNYLAIIDCGWMALRVLTQESGPHFSQAFCCGGTENHV